MCITKNHYSDKLEEAKRLDQERIEQEMGNQYSKLMRNQYSELIQGSWPTRTKQRKQELKESILYGNSIQMTMENPYELSLAAKRSNLFRATQFIHWFLTGRQTRTVIWRRFLPYDKWGLK